MSHLLSFSVNVVSGDEIYSLVYHMQQERQAAGEMWGTKFVSDFCLSWSKEDKSVAVNDI